MKTKGQIFTTKRRVKKNLFYYSICVHTVRTGMNYYGLPSLFFLYMNVVGKKYLDTTTDVFVTIIIRLKITICFFSKIFTSLGVKNQLKIAEQK